MNGGVSVHELAKFRVRLAHDLVIRATFENDSTPKKYDLVELLDMSYAVGYDYTCFLGQKAAWANYPIWRRFT